MEHSEALDQIAAALAKAQSEMQPAKKSGHNPHFKSAFATLEDVWDSCRVPLTKNGLAIVQIPGRDAQDRVGLGTMLIHSSGQWLRDFFPFPSGVKQDPQGMGAACSYFRRYAAAAVAGVVTEDDDAEASMGRGAGKEPRKPSQAPPSPSQPKSPILNIDASRLSDHGGSHLTHTSPGGGGATAPPGPVRTTTPPKQDLPKKVTQPQMKRLFAIAGSRNWPEAAIDEYVATNFGLASKSDLTFSKYDEVCNWILAHPRPKAPVPPPSNGNAGPPDGFAPPSDVYGEATP